MSWVVTDQGPRDLCRKLENGPGKAAGEKVITILFEIGSWRPGLKMPDYAGTSEREDVLGKRKSWRLNIGKENYPPDFKIPENLQPGNTSRLYGGKRPEGLAFSGRKQIEGASFQGNTPAAVMKRVGRSWVTAACG